MLCGQNIEQRKQRKNLRTKEKVMFKKKKTRTILVIHVTFVLLERHGNNKQNEMLVFYRHSSLIK